MTRVPQQVAAVERRQRCGMVLGAVQVPLAAVGTHKECAASAGGIEHSGAAALETECVDKVDDGRLCIMLAVAVALLRTEQSLVHRPDDLEGNRGKVISPER